MYVKYPIWEEGGGAGETWEKEGKAHLQRRTTPYHYLGGFQPWRSIQDCLSTFFEEFEGLFLELEAFKRVKKRWGRRRTYLSSQGLNIPPSYATIVWCI